MVQPVAVDLDIAKNVFHAYGLDAQGQKVLSRKVRRAQVEAFFAKLEPCLIGIEACATAHHGARVLKRMGHQVRLSNGRKWVMRFERTAYRGGRPNLPEPPEGAIRHEGRYQCYTVPAAGID